MADEWRPLPLADVVTLQRGFDLPAQDRQDGPVPILGSFGVTGWHDAIGCYGAGVTIGRSGASIGVATYTQVDYWPLNTALFVRDFRGNVPRFVYYLLKSIDFSAYNSGSAQPSLNRNHIAHVPVVLPPLADQRAIAEVLGALDDKIEVNNRIMATALELARALWRRSTEDACRVPLAEVVEVGLSGVWGEDGETDTARVEVVCLRGRDLEDLLERRNPSAPHRWISDKQLDRRVSSGTEIWTAGSGSLGPTLLITPMLRAWFERPVLYSNFVKRLIARPGAEELLPSAWFSLLHAWDSGDFAAYTTGTAMPNLDPLALVKGVKVPVPDTHFELINHWADVALAPQLLQENQRLESLRDAMLPALMSGQLRVREAQALVRERTAE